MKKFIVSMLAIVLMTGAVVAQTPRPAGPAHHAKHKKAHHKHHKKARRAPRPHHK